MPDAFKRVVFDIETDGLLDSLTRVHSLVIQCLDTGDVLSCADQPGYPPISKGLEVLEQAEKVYGHNIITFDIPALKKVYPTFNLTAKSLDTYVTAAYRWAHQKEADFQQAKLGKFPARLAGSHTLEAWGYRLGVHKGGYTEWCKQAGIEDPWSQWRTEMQVYCEQDVTVNLKLVQAIQDAGGLGHEALDIEHALAFYLAQQERNGVPFDHAKAVDLQALLSGRREALRQQLVERFGAVEKIKRKTFTPKVNNKARGYIAGQAITVEKIEKTEFNPNSTAHVTWALQKYYDWQPKVFTDTGIASVTDETLAGLKHVPEADLIREYLLIQKRLGMLAEGKQAWLKHARVNPQTGLYHIHGRVKQNAAVTHRAAHASPNLAQVPSVEVDKGGDVLWGYAGGFGAESRQLFHVPEGWVMIGADASGLELRCLAHYMARWDKGAYGEVILNGDIHTVNQQAAGLDTRAEAKGFIYSYLFGEGDLARGARFLPPSASASQKIQKGRAIATRFTKSLPALGNLVNMCKAKVKKNGGPGYLIMPDGRRTYIRHEHAALNSLLQASGAIICKRWIVEFNRRLTDRYGPQGWEGQWAAMLWVHDEVQIAVRPEIAEDVCRILVDSIQCITEHFQWKVALSGEAKVGRSWKETH
jgi:DNA polymerase-1